jgi:hypothetical protein
MAIAVMKAGGRILPGVALLLALAVAAPAAGQQLPDTTYAPSISRPGWPAGKGPRVAIDGAHHNFHTIDGRYRPFANLLRRDGCRLSGWTKPFSRKALNGIDLLVIANPLHVSNDTSWALPTPSAFTSEEIEAVRSWVADGGALLLIVDHMPFPGAAGALARAFGVTFSNGFARSGESGNESGNIVFRRNGGGLADHAITRGARPGEGIDSVVTFTGSAFRPDSTAIPLLVLAPGSRSLEPEVAWQFSDSTRSTQVGGWCQGAVLQAGRGRVAVFGEAAMFTAQLAGPAAIRMGMNSPAAAQNWRFLLNTIHWLKRS